MIGRDCTDWDPMSDVVQRDPRAAYDRMRERCPIAYSDLLGCSVFRHADVKRVLDDPETFSSVVSEHVSVPNGVDPPEHNRYRRLLDRHFRAEAIAGFEPRCRAIAEGIARSLPAGRIEFMETFARAFAVRVQCAFIGWPENMQEPLWAWVDRNNEAIRMQDHATLADNARVFESYVDELLRRRRELGEQAPDDIVTRLLRERINDRPLEDADIASVLRNWTVGEIGTIAAALGIIAHFLAQDGELQSRLRANPALAPAVIEEILRLHGPLVASRRITTCPVALGGRVVGAGEPIFLNWVAANRDGRAFRDPASFRLDRDPAANVLYGAGIHACPGAGLARLELRVAVEALLRHTAGIGPVAGEAVPAVYPASGYAELPLSAS